MNEGRRRGALPDKQAWPEPFPYLPAAVVAELKGQLERSRRRLQAEKAAEYLAYTHLAAHLARLGFMDEAEDVTRGHLKRIERAAASLQTALKDASTAAAGEFRPALLLRAWRIATALEGRARDAQTRTEPSRQVKPVQRNTERLIALLAVEYRGISGEWPPCGRGAWFPEYAGIVAAALAAELKKGSKSKFDRPRCGPAIVSRVLQDLVRAWGHG